MLDPFQDQGLSLSLRAFGNSPAQSLCDKVNELPLHFRKEKLALQFTIRIAAKPNYSVYKTIFNLRYVDYFNRKLRVIPTFCICVRQFLEEFNFYPDIIAIYTDCSVSNNKAAALNNNSSSIERLSGKSSVFSAELHALYLALD